MIYFFVAQTDDGVSPELVAVYGKSDGAALLWGLIWSISSFVTAFSRACVAFLEEVNLRRTRREAHLYIGDRTN